MELFHCYNVHNEMMALNSGGSQRGFLAGATVGLNYPVMVRPFVVLRPRFRLSTRGGRCIGETRCIQNYTKKADNLYLSDFSSFLGGAMVVPASTTPAPPLEMPDIIISSIYFEVNGKYQEVKLCHFCLI